MLLPCWNAKSSFFNELWISRHSQHYFNGSAGREHRSRRTIPVSQQESPKPKFRMPFKPGMRRKAHHRRSHKRRWASPSSWIEFVITTDGKRPLHRCVSWNMFSISSVATFMAEFPPNARSSAAQHKNQACAADIARAAWRPRWSQLLAILFNACT